MKKNMKISIITIMLLAISTFLLNAEDICETKCTVSSTSSENDGVCVPSLIYNGDQCQLFSFGPECDGMVWICPDIE